MLPFTRMIPKQFSGRNIRDTYINVLLTFTAHLAPTLILIVSDLSFLSFTLIKLMPIYYIPNLSASKGKDDKATNQSELNHQDFHKCLEVALSLLIKYYQEGEIWWKDGSGVDVLLKPIIHMIIGDTVSSNELINHFNTYTANCLATC
jgi:hypothetical protein